MPSSALLFGEFGQLVQNAALGVVAICGNSGSCPNAAPAMSADAQAEMNPPATVSRAKIQSRMTATNSAVSMKFFDPILESDSQVGDDDFSEIQSRIHSVGEYFFFRNDASNSVFADDPPAIGVSEQTEHPEPNAPRYKVNQPNEQQPETLAEGNVVTSPEIVRGGGLTVTGGYSSIEGFSVGGKIARTNISGPSTELAAAAHYSKVRSFLELRYTDGRFLGSSATFAPTIFASQLSATGFGDGIGKTPFSQSARGINILLNKKLMDGLSATLNYRLSDDHFRPSGKNVHCDVATFGSVLCDEIGPRTSSILTFALTYDEKVKLKDRSHRFRMRLAHDLSAGGSADFSRLRLSAAAQLGLGSGVTVSFDTEGGYMTPIGKDRLPLFERFYIGDNSMRGFDLRGIGPKLRPANATAGQNVAVGGRAYYVMRTDLALNLGKFGGNYTLQPGLFIDAGSVFLAKDSLLPGETLIGNSSKPRISAGVGLAIHTPAGKLRIDFVKPILKQLGDRPKMLSISFGTAM